jgi:inner membrane protein
MDSVTQFVLGAFVGEKVAGKEMGKKSMIYGGIIATIPDLDVFCKNFFSDSIDKFLWHRSISHSLLFAIVLPLFFVFLAQKKLLFSRYNIKPIKIYHLFFWCLLTHSLLDCLTSWGTQFFYPYPYRINISSVFIIDLFYTLPFIVAFIWIFAKNNQTSSQRRKIVNYCLVITSCYLTIGIMNKVIVEQRTSFMLKQHNIVYNNIYSSATLSNIIYWNVVYTQSKTIYASKINIFSKITPYDFIKVAESNMQLPDYFYQHPRSKEVLQLFRDSYAVTYEDGIYNVDDYRFDFFYDSNKRKYSSVICFLISTNNQGKLVFNNKFNLTSFRQRASNISTPYLTPLKKG